MTNLQAIGFTALAGAACTLLCHAFFAIAVRCRTPMIAPRCHARPPDTIYNPRASSKNNDPEHPHPHPQWRGRTAGFGYVGWTMKMSYEVMMRGVPGTGTRNNGMAGRMLDVNLDGIVLLRFHALCFRVAVLATVLCIGIVLPINLTAQCFSIERSNIQRTVNFKYDESCVDHYQSGSGGTGDGGGGNSTTFLTNYGRTTLANIPPVRRANSFEGESPPVPSSKLSFFKLIELSIGGGGNPDAHILVRLYVIVFCSWVVHWYLCYALNEEWSDVLALRRVYYLESDVYGRRKEELAETTATTMMGANTSTGDAPPPAPESPHVSSPCGDEREGGMGARESNGTDRTKEKEEDEETKVETDEGGPCPLMCGAEDFTENGSGAESFAVDAPPPPRGSMEDRSRSRSGEECRSGDSDGYRGGRRRGRPWRDPWIPNPNLRETPPYVELYSVLVSDLPWMASQVNMISDSFKQSPLVAAEVHDGLGQSNGIVGDSPNTPVSSEQPDSEDQSNCTPAATAIVNWQLELVKAFFHQCIPTQPGYSSSVAAVTIVPDGLSLAMAWRRWLGLVRPMRQLRYIRRQIRDLEACDDEDDGTSSQYHASESSTDDASNKKLSARGTSCGVNEAEGGMHVTDDDIFEELEDEEDASWTYALVDHDFIGKICDNDPEVMRWAAHYASTQCPEQTAVYAREFAFDSAYCFPYGCLDCVVPCRSGRGKGTVDNVQQLEDLKAREKDVIGKIETASAALQEMQLKAVNKLGVLLLPKCDVENTSTLPTTPTRNFSGMMNADYWDEEGGGGGALVMDDDGDREMVVPQRSRLDSAGSVASSLRDSTIATINEEGKFINRRTMDDNEERETVVPQRSRLDSAGSVSSSRRDSKIAMINEEGKFVKRQNNETLALGLSPTPQDKSIHYTPLTRVEGRNGVAEAVAMDNTYANSWITSETRGRRNVAQRRPRRLTKISASPDGVAEDVEAQDEEPSEEWRSAQRLRRLNSSFTLEAGNVQVPDRPVLESGVWGSVSSRSHQKRLWAYLKKWYIRIKSRFRLLFRTCNLPSTRHAKKDDHNSNANNDHCATAAAPSASSTSVSNDSTSTFAYVTFTSRRAAVAARQCVADARGLNRWVAKKSIPVAPMTDAATCDFCLFRGHWCRPVAMTMSDAERRVRRVTSRLCLFVVYVFYLVPLTFVASLVQPESLRRVFPEIEIDETFTGIIPGLLQTLFFALCPVIFRAIANSAGTVTSFAGTEKAQLQYYWWFMVVTAFSGTSIMTMVLNAVQTGNWDVDFAAVLLEIAATIPVQVSAVWINWIIVRTTVTLQLIYLLQVITFLLRLFRCGCCYRLTMGGGPGKHVPYRVYVDSGVVLMCTTALSFASPLVAPCAMFYFLVCTPILRRNFIFVYRPRFDCGGSRFSFLFDISVSGMLVGQVLLAAMMLLKKAFFPAVLAFLPLVPTIMFWRDCRKRFLRSYKDSGLLQTSLLDDLSEEEPTSCERREDFRRFLVDAHKAAYVPVCVGGGTASVLTAEPATVVPL